MKLNGVREYSASELERIATATLRSYYKGKIVIPVDIDLLLEAQEGVLLDLRPRLADRFGVLGVVIKGTSAPLEVYIDQYIADTKPNLYRFTVAEELAHILIHRWIIDAVTTFEDAVALYDSQQFQLMHRNAKRLAAALLMPPEPVLEEARIWYKELVQVAGFRDPEAITKQIASALARSFQVSFTTMRYRMNEYPVCVTQKVQEAVKNERTFLD